MRAADSELRGESWIEGWSEEVEASPVTIAEVIAPLPTKPSLIDMDLLCQSLAGPAGAPHAGRANLSSAYERVDHE